MSNKAIIQAIILSSGKNGINLDKISEISKIDNNTIESEINELINIMQNDENSGIIIKKFGNNYSIITKPEIIKKVSNLNRKIEIKNPLSTSLLEVLAIIAYNQPCTRSKIYDIKNIDPTFQIKKLIDLGFVEELGRSETQGMPFIYGVTDLFYSTFGISSLDELPEIVIDNNIDDDIDFFDSNRDE